MSITDSEIINILLLHVPVKNYRIFQDSLDKIIIKIVAGEGYSQKDTDFIIKYLNDYFNNKMSVEIEMVDFIPPLPSGKRSVFISKVKAFQQ